MDLDLYYTVREKLLALLTHIVMNKNFIISL